jgi:hypothetical protein
MRVTAGLCPYALIVWDFNQHIFPCAPWTILDRNPRTGAQNGDESALRVAFPGKQHPGATQLSRRNQQGAATFYEIEQNPVSLGMP